MNSDQVLVIVCAVALYAFDAISLFTTAVIVCVALLWHHLD